ncbi:MAG TPA: T9SS type A sorting domain-containing protein, partial [Cytophagaceae bacterium]|nr:T9SS type A sorting domain-containing protein [Cytophagaceae bacterium]
GTTAQTGVVYSWTPTDNLDDATSATPTISSAGTATAGTLSYTVSAIDEATGCIGGTDGVTVTVNPSPSVDINASGATTICDGQNVTLSTTATGVTYQWQKDGVNIAGATTASYVVATSGSYAVVGTTSNNCTTTSTAIVVTVNPNPVAATITVTPTTACVGDGINVGVVYGPGTATYSFTQPTLSNQIGSGGSAGFGFGGGAIASGDFVLTKTALGCSTTTTVHLTVNPLPNVPTITASGPTTMCGGQSVTLSTSATGVTYQWQKDGINISGATSSSYVATTGGNYTVMVTNANNCSATSTATTITVSTTLPQDFTFTVTSPVCQGGLINIVIGTPEIYAVTYTLSPLPSGMTYAGGSSGSWGSNENYQLPSNATSFTATVTATRNGTSCQLIKNVPVTVNPAPSVPNVTASGSTTICSGQSVTLSTTATGVSYQWKKDGTNISGATSSSYVATVSGSYTLVVSIGSCTATSTATTITVNPNPTAGTITGVPTSAVCAGTHLSVGVTYNDPGINYTFTQPTLANGCCSGGTTGYFFFGGDAIGSGDFILTKIAAGCSTATVAHLEVNPLPAVPMGTAGSRCGIGTVALSATTTTSGATINWYAASSGGTSLGTGTSFTTPSISATTTYYAEASLNGCVSARTAVVATIKAYPANQMQTTSITSCADAGATLTFATGPASAYIVTPYPTGIHSIYPGGGGNGGYQFAYIGFDPVSVTTNYSITGVTYANGCSTIVSIPITVNPVPTITNTTPGAHCGTGTVVLGATASAGTLNWYSASTGGTSLGTGTSYTTPSITATTTYYVAATSGSCTSARTPVVATIGTTAPTITGSTPGSRCGAGTVTLSATASSGATVNWYTASIGGTLLGTGTSFTTPSISATTTYYAEAILNGCVSATRTAVVATVNTCRTGAGENDLEIVADIIDILPNPSETNFNLIVHSQQDKTIEIIVTDINGQIVQQGTSKTNEPYLFGNDFSAGVYVVKVINGEKIKTYKVVKIK